MIFILYPFKHDPWLFSCDRKNFIKVYSFESLPKAKEACWNSWELCTPCAKKSAPCAMAVA